MGLFCHDALHTALAARLGHLIDIRETGADANRPGLAWLGSMEQKERGYELKVVKVRNKKAWLTVLKFHVFARFLP